MTIFHYVIKPDGKVLAYTRQKKAEQVARLYDVQIVSENQLTPAQIDNASHMYF